jgi:hypothetical protein
MIIQLLKSSQVLRNLKVHNCIHTGTSLDLQLRRLKHAQISAVVQYERNPNAEFVYLPTLRNIQRSI